MRYLGLFWWVVGAAAIASCAAPVANAPKLERVAPLPKPSLPAWIDSISPTQRADALSQIRIIFAKPVTALEALSGDGPRDVLGHIEIEPALRGHFTVLTPKMIGFIGDQALPIGTRVQVTLTAGLQDLDGDRLDRDLAWTFETVPVAFTNLPQLQQPDADATATPVGLAPKLQITANARVDASSLSSHATLNAQRGNDVVPLTASLESEPTPYPGSNAQALFNPALDNWTYDLRPARDLRRGTTYVLAIEPGVEPVYGNVPTSARFSGEVRTYAPLAIVPTPAASQERSGRFAGGDPVIAFNNPIDPASLKDAVTFSPAPSGGMPRIEVPDYRPNVIAVDPYALDPRSTYGATIAAGVKDVFGQSLGEQQRVTIRTGDFSPGAWAPSGTNVFPAGAPIALNFYATNLPGNRYQSAFSPMTPSQMLGSPSALALLPDYRKWPAHALAGAKPNAQSVVRVALQNEIGGSYGAVAYGFRTALDAADADPTLTGIVQITNLGVFAQWFPAHGIVLVQHLSDGAAVGGARVTIYRVDENSKLSPQQCASATTNAGGEADFRGTDVERCSVAAAANQAPNLGFVVREGGDVATVTAWNYSGIVRFAVFGGWTSGAPLSRGTIFSDRQMYQPGERAQITGAAYYVAGSDVVADANATYKVTLSDPSNNVTSLGTARTDSYGVFSLPIAFSKQQALGYYVVDAKGPTGNDINGSFRVAEFKPPNFKLTLTLDAASATAGSSVRAKVAGAYLFGAPLQGGTARAYVTRDVATLQPKGWDDFSFGPQWYYPEQTPSFETDVLQRDLPLDANGATSLDVPVPRDLPFPMSYRVDMETSDVSNLSVADSKSFLALPSDAAIGLASDAVGKAGTAMPIRVIVTDAGGTPIAGRAVHLQLQKMTYVSATQEEAGGQSAQQAIKYDTVSTADVTSSDAPVSAQLTPPQAGPYRVFANFAGARSDAANTSIQLFIFGAGEADWGLNDPNAVAIQLDKKQYAIGDTATALVASPYSDADVYFSVVRNDVIYRTTLRAVSGAVRVPFKITQAMLPNAAVQAVVVRRVAASRSVAGSPRGRLEGARDTLALTGMTGFNVGLADRYLKLAIVPQSGTVRPGAPQRIAFAVTNAAGSPVRGEVVGMVVNDAILQLSGYRLPDLVQTVFAQQPIATIFADNRENVTLKTLTPPLEKGYGYGGGFLAGAAGTRVRANFQPMAYYGVLRTDASGRAEASFTMPDDLTTWRVMAVALAADRRHFATADSTFVSNQPLIASPLLPQFARPTDRFELGLSIANQTNAGGALEFVMRLTGALAFAQGDPQTQRGSEQISTGVRAFRYPVVVGTPATTTVEAQVRLGSQSDAFSVPFAPRDRESTDSAIDSGSTRGDASIPLALDRGGTLRVTLANSVVPQFVTPSERVMDEDALPLADESASRLVIASALRKLRTPYRLKLSFDPDSAIAANLDALLSDQRGDGGFGAYLNADQSDPFVSAAALSALEFARGQGVAVNSDAIAKVAGFVSRLVANPGVYKWCANDPVCKAQLRFEALWALAAQGSPRSDFLADIVAQSNAFDSATQIRLARYLLRVPDWRSRGTAMAARLEQTLYVTGRYASANVSRRWSWLGSVVDAQSQMLQLLLERHAAADRLDGAVRALVAQQCKCGWPTVDDTAAAVTALAAYAANERLMPSNATATVGDRTIGSAAFGSTASSQTFTVAVSSLPKNAPLRVSLRGDGNAALKGSPPTLHYLVLYTYPVAADAPGELAAFRVIRTLNDPSSATSPTSQVPIATMDLATALPVALAAGRVFDIGVRTIVDHPVDGLLIDDPLPAGFEAVDTSFRTALQALVPQSNSWEIDTSQIYRDRVVAYAAHLQPGVYDLHYLVRSVTPGTFAWPGARVYLRNAPEEFGRSAGTTLRITQ